MLPDAEWLDGWGWARGVGSDEVREALAAMAVDPGPNRVFDTTDRGLALRLVVRDMNVREVGSYAVASFALRAEGLGVHAQRDDLWVTLAFVPTDAGWRLADGHIGIANGGERLVQSLDYCAYPEARLAQAEQLFTERLDFGTPYTDWGYFGWWSEDTVFGVYRVDPARDGMPRPGKTSGYASLWVDSAAETHAALVEAGATFPRLPAINDVEGVDPQPGFTQIYAIDPEGNGILFTEYPGN
jgi:hypothetical protein